MTLWLLLLIVPLFLGIWAQFRIMDAYRKNSQIGTRTGVTGREAAALVLRAAGISNVSIEAQPGELTDHYDPTRKALVLSEANYHGTSLAAVGVAAHEAGHAIQDKVNYPMMRVRMGLVPITQISSMVLPFVILGGFFFKTFGLIYLGIACYSVLTLFQLITLPVEFDATRRAKVELAGLGIIDRDEAPGVNETLNAAAWTYVAAFIASLGNLLYLVLQLTGSNRESEE